MIPGTYPAMNSAATEVPPAASEYVIKALDGGISSPDGADAPLVAAQSALSYPCSSSPFSTMLPTAAAAADAEPEIAPKRAFAPTFVTSKAPGSFPSIAITKSTRRFAIPPWFIRFPARMKKGIAVKLNLLIPTKMRCEPVTTDTSSATV